MAGHDGSVFCGGCGAALNIGDEFCFRCGRSVRPDPDGGPSRSPESGDGGVRVNPPAASSRKRWWLLGGIAAAIAILLGVGVYTGTHHGSGGSTPKTTEPSTHTITGTLVVDYPNETYSVGDSCSVPLGFGGESVGDQAVVTNGSGATIATGSLTLGLFVGYGDIGPNVPGGCGFRIVIPNVPRSSFYQVTIDGHGSPQYSESQLQGAHWKLSLVVTP